MTHVESCCKSLLCGLLLALGLALAPSSVQAQNPPPPNTVAFSAPQNISNNPASFSSSGQQMAVDSRGMIYTVWLQNSPNGVLFSRSVDGGKTFSSPQILSNSVGVNLAQLPNIAVDPAGNINVTWIGNGPTAVLSRSTDGGATFSAPTAIANAVAFSSTSLAVDSAGNIYFSWANGTNNSSGNVFFSRSLDQGATFSAPTQVSTYTTNANPVLWALGLGANGDLDLVWSDQRSIWLSQSKDGGVTFSSPKMAAQARDLTNISLALDSTGTIYIAYNTEPVKMQATLTGIADVFLVSSKDGGNTFSTTNLTNNPDSRTFSCCPQVVVDSGGNLDLVWVDPAPVITVARSTDGGSSFSRAAASASGNSVGSPRIAVDSKGAINVIWAAPNDIFYSRSTDNGTTFSSPQNISNDNHAELDRPVLALDPCGNVNVVWQDFSPGPGSIFFSRGTTPESIASGCGSAIARIQSADAYPGDSVTLNNTTAGNFVIVAASWADLTSDPTVSDSALNTWTPLPVLRGPAGEGAVSVKLFYAMNIKGGNTTITLSSSPFDVGIHAVEYSGVATSNALDVISTAVADGSTGTTTPASGSFTPTEGDLVYAYFGDEGTAQNAITAGPGYSMITMTGDHVDASQENLASSGTQTASFTLGATTWGWALYVATFKASAGQH